MTTHEEMTVAGDASAEHEIGRRDERGRLVLPLALESFRSDMEGCSRCSSCKWIPLAQIRSQRYSQVCPSIRHFDFHAYSGSGKMNVALSILDGRSGFDESAADIFYACTLCGGCDVGCKVYRNDIDLTDTFHEARARAVELGHARLEHLALVENLRAENNVFGEPKGARADWDVDTGLLDANREPVDVLFHVGCRLAYDETQRDDLFAAVEVLQASGLRVGTSKNAEACCGQRAYEAGFGSELHGFGDDMAGRVRSSGAQYVAVACSDCFGAFNYLYPKNGLSLGVPVRHVAEIAAELVGDGRLAAHVALGAHAPVSVPSVSDAPVADQRTPAFRTVTYHDPCNLGRKGEDFAGHFAGNKLDRPDDTRRRGVTGRYDAPRELLRSLPGVELVEMQRIREYSWCCGAGGGCFEADEEFSVATAVERLDEAMSTGADALVTSCPWCVTNFGRGLDAMRAAGDMRTIEVIGISEMAVRQLGGVPVTIADTVAAATSSQEVS